MITIGVIAVPELDEAAIRKFFKGRDNTFGPMGSGGFSFTDEPDGSVIVRMLDCDPAPAERIRMKDRQIWVPTTFTGIISGMLAGNKVLFSIDYKKFSDTEEAKRAFAQAA